jgi:hypothetical protein
MLTEIPSEVDLVLTVNKDQDRDQDTRAAVFRLAFRGPNLTSEPWIGNTMDWENRNPES